MRQRRNSFCSTNPSSFSSSSSLVNFSRAFVVWCFLLWCVFVLKMIETSKVSFLVFYLSKTDDRWQRKTLRETSFFSRSKYSSQRTRSRGVFFRFFSTFVYLNDETLFKNTQDTKTRCLLFALRSKKCEYYFITTIRTTIKLLLLRRW